MSHLRNQGGKIVNVGQRGNFSEVCLDHGVANLEGASCCFFGDAWVSASYKAILSLLIGCDTNILVPRSTI